MSITQPSSNYKGYELVEWWKDTQKFIGQKGLFDYQVDPSTISKSYVGPLPVFESTDTSTIDMYLGNNETSVFLTNPGDIYLPAASLYLAKEYYLIGYRNGNITWTTQEITLIPSAGEYINYETSSWVLIDTSVAFIFKHIVSDGINNWIILP